MNLSLTPKVLRWARERAGLDQTTLAKKVTGKPTAERVKQWEKTGMLTFAQARKLARATHTPEGFLYLNEPPDDRLPIPDFRTVGVERVRRPSPDLLDTVYMMQRRQTWMRDFLIEEAEPRLEFIGRATLNNNPQKVASEMRATLGVTEGWANEESTWTDALIVQAHRRHYAFEICTGFWDCLIHHHQTGRIVSIDRVRDEIIHGDALETWVKDSAPSTLFASTAVAAVTQNYADMIRWVQTEPQFRSEAKTEFAQVADGWLCAYARVNAQYVVVTHEELSPQAKRRVPLPNVCRQFGVDYIDPFTMLKNLKVCFQWSAGD